MYSFPSSSFVDTSWCSLSANRSDAVFLLLEAVSVTTWAENSLSCCRSTKALVPSFAQNFFRFESYELATFLQFVFPWIFLHRFHIWTTVNRILLFIFDSFSLFSPECLCTYSAKLRSESSPNPYDHSLIPSFLFSCSLLEVCPEFGGKATDVLRFMGMSERVYIYNLVACGFSCDVKCNILHTR